MREGDSGRNGEGGVLTVWSVSGGRTITLSMVFITTRQSSFRTRFKTVFSHTVAKSVRLQIQAIGEARGKSGMPAPPEAPQLYFSSQSAILTCHPGNP